MATFRCLQSGNTVTFTLQHDIDSMRGHQGYVRIDDEAQKEAFDAVPMPSGMVMTPPEQIKRRGRPRKGV
jgi:hypothetical protein